MMSTSQRRCSGGHEHNQLLSGRSKACEKYPPRWVAVILRTLRQTMCAAGCGEEQGLMGPDRHVTIAAVEAGPTLEELEVLAMLESTNSAQEVRDRSTGLPLDPAMVKKQESLRCSRWISCECVRPATATRAWLRRGRPPIPPDWVDIDKGNSIKPNFRSRLVCQETRRRSTIEVEDWPGTFAATPFHEAFRLQLCLLMTGPGSEVQGDDEVFVDAVGHFPSTSSLFVTINGLVYKLLKEGA